MDATGHNRYAIICRHIVLACASGLLIIGGAAELGWALDVSELRSIFPGFIAMNPTTAAMFLMGASAMLGCTCKSKFSPWVTIATSLAMVIIGGSKDIGYLLGYSLPVDRLFFWTKLEPSGPFHGNALAPNAALSFVLMGIALPFFCMGLRRLAFASAATILAMAVAVTALVGYVFAALPFYRLGTYAPMALPTSISFLLLGVGTIALRPNDGIAGLFTEEAAGSVLVRRILPIATLTPLLIGMARILMEGRGMLESAAASALATVATMAVIAGLILAAAKTLNASDRKRLDVERQMAKLTEQLRQEAAKSDQANQSKSQFLANMSHEVRTPLNGVLGTTTLLEMRALDPDVLRLVRIIRTSGETLLRVIDDILDFSKIEAGKLEIENTPVNLADLVRDVVALYQAQAETRGISIVAIVPKIDPAPVLADPVRIKQILGNLISNAVKFTSIGCVYASLETSVASDGRLDVVIDIRDTGIGIAEDRQSLIFESFTQADGSTHRRFGGTGLGLAICKRLVELMGGSITLSSAPERGSTFTVRLKLQLAPVTTKADDGPLEDPESSIGLRVLLAEDNEVNAMVASALLENLGCSVVVVGDGLSAIAAVAADRFDVVLMDIHMPVCDGLEATRAIRHTAKGANLRIIALTASALFEDRQECFDAGMDGFLSKPFTSDGLRTALARDTDTVSRENEPRRSISLQ